MISKTAKGYRKSHQLNCQVHKARLSKCDTQHYNTDGNLGGRVQYVRTKKDITAKQMDPILAMNTCTLYVVNAYTSTLKHYRACCSPRMQPHVT